ncbi:MAG: hypothetical protein ACI9HA_003440, partial [Dinoroseobacter sp.]
KGVRHTKAYFFDGCCISINNLLPACFLFMLGRVI